MENIENFIGKVICGDAIDVLRTRPKSPKKLPKAKKNVLAIDKGSTICYNET